MNKGDMEQFKLLMAAMIDELIRDAVERGAPTEQIFRQLGAESLELSARIHANFGGSESAFIGMAADLIAAVRAGAQTQ